MAGHRGDLSAANEIRRFSLHERYSMARHNLGFPHAITVVVEYPSGQSPTRDWLCTRVCELQAKFPLLCALVEGAKTSRPCFQHSKPHAVEDLVHDRRLDSEDSHWVLRDARSRMEVLDGPLWQLGLYTGVRATYLTLAANHILLDGRGLFNLLGALLIDDISAIPKERLGDVAVLDDTIDLRPGLLFVAGLIWKELIIPHLPVRLQSYLKGQAPWPRQMIRSPAKCEQKMAAIELALEVLATLKERGRARGVQTLHPTLILAYGVAVGSILSENMLRLETPGTMRDTSLGHGYCTGNYTNVSTVDFIWDADTPFWDEAKRISTYMRSPSGRKRALEYMGALSYIPDPAPSAARKNSDRPTGWEDFLGGKLDRLEPPSASLNVSNIGKVDLPSRATDLLWIQSASPVGAVLEMNVVTHDGGMRAAVVWREGAMVNEMTVEMINRLWIAILHRLADQGEDWSIQRLVA